MRTTRRTVIAGLTAGAFSVLSGQSTAWAEDAPTVDDPADEDIGCGESTDDGVAALAAAAYAAFRVVRAVPGDPSTPEITLPAGYSPVPGSAYQVASRGEYIAFITGARDDAGVTVSVRWPGQRIAAVIASDRRLPLTVDPTDPERVSFQVPVMRSSASADQPTIQMFSYLSTADTGVVVRIEHNDANRAVGYWARVPWPAVESRAVINYMIATEAVLRDSGLAAAARGRGHSFYLMGFETNNLLHLDNPPHWHLSYYPGRTTSASPATVPHYWVDKQGRTFYNGQDVTGKPRAKYYAGDPAPIYDGSGKLVVTTTIRADGGLDIDPPNGPRYSFISRSGDFGGPIEVWRAGGRWRSVSTTDDVVNGVLRTEVRGYRRPAVRERFEYRYDPLTGHIQSKTELC